MKRLFLVGMLALAASATVAQARPATKWSWSESYAEARVIKTVRYHPPYADQEIASLQAEIANAKQELASATQADDPAAEEAAMTRLGEAQQALAELRQGYPAVDATCIGSGRPTDKADIHFQRFRCVVYIESQTTNWSGKGRVYVTARDRTRMFYRWI